MWTKYSILIIIFIFNITFQAKVIVAEQTEREIDETRSQYIPVAVRTQLLFFCTTDLANVDPMYQYSLEWYVRIFLAGIANSERAGKYFCSLKFWCVFHELMNQYKSCLYLSECISHCDSKYGYQNSNIFKHFGTFVSVNEK